MYLALVVEHPDSYLVALEGPWTRTPSYLPRPEPQRQSLADVPGSKQGFLKEEAASFQESGMALLT